jgi:hypothetical protein
MTRNTLKNLTLALAATLALAQVAHAAGLSEFDIDTRFRAKIVKEKSRQNAVAASNFNFNQRGGQAEPECGSQNIGNVDTGGRPGTAPREVFVFAPNAINLVSANGCR